jgi:uncharacterized protein (DUF302 family)
MSDTSPGTAPAPTVEEALHVTLDFPFDEAVDRVQLEHELGGFETVKVTRLDNLVKGALEEEVRRTALVVVCHAEIARDAMEIDQALASMLPCTTAVYEDEDGTIHARHLSATKAIRDLGCCEDDEAAQDLVEMTSERMDRVWEGVERLAAE